MQSGTCSHCQVSQNPRRRDFSEQAWKVLVVWEEIGEGAIDRPLCDDCYIELRDILIDRAAEIEATLAAHFRTAPRRRGNKRAGASSDLLAG